MFNYQSILIFAPKSMSSFWVCYCPSNSPSQVTVIVFRLALLPAFSPISSPLCPRGVFLQYTSVHISPQLKNWWLLFAYRRKWAILSVACKVLRVWPLPTFLALFSSGPFPAPAALAKREHVLPAVCLWVLWLIPLPGLGTVLPSSFPVSLERQLLSKASPSAPRPRRGLFLSAATFTDPMASHRAAPWLKAGRAALIYFGALAHSRNLVNPE